MRIIQISDTHLSPSKTHFNANWQPLAAWISAQSPDMVVHTGDLALDGADHDEDVAFSMQQMKALVLPLLIVPGNHDIGHMPDMAQPMDTVRIERWRRLVGREEWVQDVGEWRFIGLNSQVFGHGSAAEDWQFDWLDVALSGANGRPIAIFAHKPLFVDDPDEGDSGCWALKPVARQKMRDLLTRYNVALYASGHLHRAWTGKLGATNLAWVPPASFIIGAMERDMPGKRILGAIVHTLDDRGVHSEIVEVAGMTPYLLDDVVDEVYPSVKAPVEALE